MSDVAGRGLWARMYGTAILDASAYEEVEADRDATRQAALVVLVASAAAASQDYDLGWAEMLSAGAASALQWPVWAGITYLVGVRLLGGTATWEELLRTLGFARGPGILVFLTPVIGGIHILAQAWMLVAGIVAIRQALDFGTLRALLTALLGIVPYWVVHVLFLH